jgi:hypothetical protein
MVAAGLAPDSGSGFLDFAYGDAADVPEPRPSLASTTSFGSGPEPEGTLELVAGDGSPGTHLTFRLPVPSDFSGRGAEARLLVAAQRGEDPAFAERTGLLLDLHSLLGSSVALATPGQDEVGITLRVPRHATFDSLAFQAVWRSAERREFTDAVELALAR